MGSGPALRVLGKDEPLHIAARKAAGGSGWTGCRGLRVDGLGVVGHHELREATGGVAEPPPKPRL